MFNERNNIKECLELLNKFIVSLASIVNASTHKKFVPLSNQKCEIQLTFINLLPNQYNQEFHYYPFKVKLGKCVGSCKTLNDFSNSKIVLKGLF